MTETEYRSRRYLGQLPNGTKVIVLRWKFKSGTETWLEYFADGRYCWDNGDGCGDRKADPKVLCSRSEIWCPIAPMFSINITAR